MSEISGRYRLVADGMTQRVAAVPDAAWDNPSPCEGWDARDIVRHIVEWIPAFLAAGAGVELPTGPSVDDDPVAAWQCLTNGIQTLLDDPQIAEARFSHPRAGDHSVEDAIAMFFLGDVLIHTWDVARATGGDESLDVDEVHRMLSGVEPYDDMLRASGQYGQRVTVPDDADEQARLIAFMGRQP
ncbi:MAG: TIGR03086 family protein [Ilumatobacteraceae bacterium]|nr:TIGR03086 family protein [Ilumatobacteraceae bacterium]